MGRGGHGLPKVLLRPAMPYPSKPCGWATPETAISGGPSCRAGGLRLSSTPLETPRRRPMVLGLVLEIRSIDGRFGRSLPQSAKNGSFGDEIELIRLRFKVVFLLMTTPYRRRLLAELTGWAWDGYPQDVEYQWAWPRSWGTFQVYSHF
jgi:hypothetical protein